MCSKRKKELFKILRAIYSSVDAIGRRLTMKTSISREDSLELPRMAGHTAGLLQRFKHNREHPPGEVNRMVHFYNHSNH